MTFPDRIEPSLTPASPPGEGWRALTTAEGLSAWFGERASIDLRPGGAESGFAQLPAETLPGTYDSHGDGWTRELSEPAEHLDAA